MDRDIWQGLRRLTQRAIALAVLGAFSLQSALAETTNATPQWVRDGVVYEIFPRQFSESADFNGITARLGELHDLGVTILWLMPIHPIGEKLRKGSYGSPYAARDYYAVNPDYGTKADLKKLISEAHRRDMKVILDIVLLHTAWDSVLMERPDFYKRDASGKIVPPVPEWSDVAGLNYDNPAVRDYMIDMLKHWVTDVELDGFRCDTASMLPTSFWAEAIQELKRTKPDLMMLAEADKPELLTNGFDIDYAWPMLNTLQNVLGNCAPAYELRKTWESDRARYPEGALRMNMSDNHDQARAVARFGIRGALAASAFTFTLDGVPMLYNGMEVGDATESGDPSLFELAPILWHPKDRPPLRRIYRNLIKLRAAHPALRSGSVVWLTNSNPESLVTYLRQDAEGEEEFMIAINFSNRRLDARVELDNPARFTPVAIDGIRPSGAPDLPKLGLDGFEWRIYRRPGNAMAAK